MSAIFISHSSCDADAAGEIKDWLVSLGHQAVFLDFDPVFGFPAGVNWEQELYRQLRSCRCLIALLSESWRESQWCFAELTQARALGKAVFIAKIGQCDAFDVASDIQQVDLTADREQGLRRLEDGLKRAGLDPKDLFERKPDRPLYPGLFAFEEEDAGVFFGRDADIANAMDTITRVQRQGEPKLVFFLGASGSGKSSLVRAGLLPRLHRDPARWVIAGPVRPREQPIDELAIAVSKAFAQADLDKPWSQIAGDLSSALRSEAVDSIKLRNLIGDLISATGQINATLLLVVDQAEELFGFSYAEPASAFLRLLKAISEGEAGPILVVSTLRSDFLGEFQSAPLLNGVRYEEVMVDQLALSRFPVVIEGPADLEGVELEPGLVSRMVQEATSPDALPLLAFSLRELYEEYGDNKRLTIDEYDQLGGLEGAVQKAAQETIGKAQPSEQELAALKEAFVPSMVGINEEGQYARRRAHLDEMPKAADRLLKRLVNARLLVTDRDAKNDKETIEVAHEALLRAWGLLGDWLRADRDKLRLTAGLRSAARDWSDGGKKEDLLVHRQGRLQDVRNLVSEPRFSLSEDAPEREYLDACIAWQEAEDARRESERRRQLEDAKRVAEAQRRVARRTRWGLIVVSGLLVVAMVSGAIAMRLREQAEAEADRANQARAELKQQNILLQARERLASSKVERETNAECSLALALEGYRLTTEVGKPAVGFADELRLALQSTHVVATLQASDAQIGDVSASASGIIAVIDTVRLAVHLWDWRSEGEPRTVSLPATPTQVEWVPETDKFLIATKSGQVLAFHASKQTLEPEVVYQGNSPVTAMAISPAGDRLAIALWSEHFLKAPAAHLVIDMETREVLTLPGSVSSWTQALAWNPDGSRLAAATNSGLVPIWELEALRSPRLIHRESAPLVDVAWSPEGDSVALGSEDGKVVVVDADRGRIRHRFLGHSNQVFSVAWISERLLVSGSWDRSIRVWDLEVGTARDVLTGHSSAIRVVEPLDDGRLLVSGAKDGTIRIWSPEHSSSSTVLARVDHWIWDAAWQGSTGGVVVAGDDGDLMLVSDSGRPEVTILEGHTDDVTRIRVSPDGLRFATSSVDGSVRVWEAATGTEQLAIDPGIGWVHDVAWSPDSPIFAATGINFSGKVASSNTVLWDLESNEMDARLVGTVSVSVAWNPVDNQLAYAPINESAIDVRDVKHGKAQTKRYPINKKPGTAIWELTWSPQGDRLAAACDDGWVHILEPESERVVRTWNAHRAEVKGVDWSPDGTQIATASMDNTVKLWDVQTGERIATIHGHASGVRSVDWSDDGKRLLTASEDGTARWFLARTEDVVSLAETQVARGLTEPELALCLGGELEDEMSQPAANPEIVKKARARDVLEQGLEAAERGEYDEALATFERLVEISDDPELAGEICIAAPAEMSEAILPICNRAIELSPNDPRAYFARAENLRLVNRFDDALSDAQRALELDPDSPVPHALVARIRLSRLESMLPTIEASLPEAKAETESIMDALKAYADAGGKDRSILMASVVRALGIERLRVAIDEGDLLAKGQALVLLGLEDQATSAFRSAMESSPDDAELHTAVCLTADDQTAPERLSACETAIRLDPMSEEAHLARARAFALLSDHDRAVMDCQRAISLSPESVQARVLCGEVFLGKGTSQFERGQTREGVEAIRQGIEYFDDALSRKGDEELAEHARELKSRAEALLGAFGGGARADGPRDESH